MRRRWIAAIVPAALLLVGSGCGALILHAASKGDDAPSRVSEGMTRGDVEAKLGSPLSAQRLPDGGSVAIYQFRLPDGAAQQLAKEALAPWFVVCGGGYGGAAPCGVFTEFFYFPYAIYKAATGPRGQVTFTYGPDTRLVLIGAPPAYGPVNDAIETPTAARREAYGLIDAVDAPSVGAIRELCRRGSRAGAPTPGEEQHVDCVATGLATWGFE